MQGSAKDICAIAAGARCSTGTAIPVRDLASTAALAEEFPRETEKRHLLRE
jgi:hypothetical protein